MELLALVFYAAITLSMVASCFFGKKGMVYEFPFWAGVIASGWFLPQAIGGYHALDDFPAGAYWTAMLSASFCNASMWFGFEYAKRRPLRKGSWLAVTFNKKRLFVAASALCVFGWFFQYRLAQLPEEMLAASQWSGISTIYLFFASVFQIGFIALWLVYLSRRKWGDLAYLFFLLPCLWTMVVAALLYGRRAAMMGLFSYLFIGAWFVLRKTIPRWIVLASVLAGLLLVNGISTYRGIMQRRGLSLSDKSEQVLRSDFIAETLEIFEDGGPEFRNYVFMIALYRDLSEYDYGATHWNQLINNFVPAQIVGREFKNALLIETQILGQDIRRILVEKYGFEAQLGATLSGYTDCFGSFSWFGCIKFLLIGCVMGMLYRHAMAGHFLAQLLYVYVLGAAMHAISHGTGRFLPSIWIYFFALGYPAIAQAAIRVRKG